MDVLIADDEGFVRRGIIASLPWESMGIDRIYEAEDGLQALNLALEHKPQILLSDIRMPKMDGIELIDKLKKIFAFQVIFMSAYSDKEYLKSAIRFNALDYVEKPIDLPLLQTALENAVDRIRRERQGISISPEEEIKMLMVFENNLHMERFQSNFSGFFLHEAFVIDCETTDYVNVCENMKSIADGYRLQCGIFAPVVVHERRIIGIACSREQDVGAFSELLNELFRRFHDATADGLFIARGGICMDYGGIPRSHHRALQLHEEEFFWYGYASSATVDMSSSHTRLDRESKLLENFSQALMRMSGEGIYASLENALACLIECKPNNMQEVRSFLYKLYEALSDHAEGLGISLHIVTGQAYATIYAQRTLSGYKRFLSDEIAFFLDSASIIPSDKIIAAKAAMVIERCYDDTRMTIEFICARVYASRAFVCNSYKKETGKTLNVAITEYRIAKACELLQNENNSLSYIAEMTGFTDHNYFTKCFKKNMGITPSEYRRKEK